MKTLYLVRHAKALNRNKPVPDYQRPLSKRGKKDAFTMAQYVRHHGSAPEVFVSSPAPRALETARIFARAYNYPKNKIITHAVIYDEAAAADAKPLLQIIHALNNAYQTAAIFGHDPLVTVFARFLCRDFTASLPTGAALCATFQVRCWSGIARDSGEIRFFHAPQRQGKGEPTAVQALPLDGSFELSRTGNEKALIDRLKEQYTVKREKPVRVLSTYYDTFDWRLFNQRLTLAKANGALTLQSLADGTVLECVKITSTPVFLSDFPPGNLQDHLAPIIEVRALMKLFNVTSQRKALRILNDNKKTVLKLIVQEDSVYDDHTTWPLAPRLQIQPVRGYDRQARQMVRWLTQQGCTPAQDRLYDRSLAALQKTPSDYTTRPNLQLDPMLRADAATKIILQFLCQIIRGNEQGLIADIDTEFLHDFRVAVRRTRTALGQIKRVFPVHLTTRFKRDFAWLGRMTNAQRDLDVYLLHQERYHGWLPAPMHADIEPFFAHLRQERAKAHRQLVRALTTKKYADMLRCWEAFLAEPPQPAASAVNAQRPILVVAQKRIWKKWHRVVKLGADHIEVVDDPGLHALRIECKKLRYLLEFFTSLFPAESITAALKRLRRLQDSLGHYHDLCVQQEALCRFAARFAAAEPQTRRTRQTIDRLITILEQEKQALHHSFAEIFQGFAAYTPPQGT